MAGYAERELHNLFKRCLECPKTTPSCPTCDDDKVCSLRPRTCDTCEYTTCIANPTPSTSSAAGPNVGAIAGGVVGGVALIAAVVFLIWRFWIKQRREQQDRELQEEWAQDDIAQHKRGLGFQRMTADAASTRTRASLANSILSRASNIIQIAYIPGVTNRSNNSTPVPPIPAAFRSGQQTPKTPLSNEGDALFFRPDDLRNSAWSDASSFRTAPDHDSQNSDTSSIRSARNKRDTQYTMRSLTPSLARASIASDIVYLDDATATPMPTTTVQRVAPRMVSIKPASPPTADSPARSQFSGSNIVSRNRLSAENLSGLANNYAPAVSSPLAPLSRVSEEDEETSIRQSLISDRDSQPQPPTSPFYDASERPVAAANPSATRLNPYASMASTIGRSSEGGVRRGGKSVGGLSAVIEEANRRAGESSSSPFSDEHATE